MTSSAPSEAAKHWSDLATELGADTPRDAVRVLAHAGAALSAARASPDAERLFASAIEMAGRLG